MPQIAQVVKSTFRINHIGGNCPYALSNTTARGEHIGANVISKLTFFGHRHDSSHPPVQVCTALTDS